MRRGIVAVGAFALVIVGSAACEKITHFDEFAVNTPPGEDAGPEASGPDATPADEICRRCPNTSPDLRHPPCPTDSTAPDDGQIYVYAWRALRLGVNKDPMLTLDPAGYDQKVGYDLDCSDRAPTGLPAKCAAIIPDAGPEAETPWKLYPHGIDNALAQRFLGPLYLGALKVDSTTEPLDITFSRQLNDGKGSILTIVYNWNGTPDDRKVSVRIVSAFRLAGADVDPNKVPKWDGTDQWIAATDRADPDLGNEQIPQVNSKTDDAYIANGVLVTDYSFLKPLYNHIVNGGVAVYVPLYDMHMVANITKEKLDYQQFFGRWPLEDFRMSNDSIAAFLAACDAVKLFALKRALPGLSASAADILLDDKLPATTPCDALTVTWAADAVRGTIGGYQAFSSAPTPCP